MSADISEEVESERHFLVCHDGPLRFTLWVGDFRRVVFNATFHAGLLAGDPTHESDEAPLRQGFGVEQRASVGHGTEHLAPRPWAFTAVAVSLRMSGISEVLRIDMYTAYQVNCGLSRLSGETLVLPIDRAHQRRIGITSVSLRYQVGITLASSVLPN